MRIGPPARPGSRLSTLLGLLAAICIAGFFAACAKPEGMHAAADYPLPGVERTMKTAGFWIARHPSPDAVILTPPEIEAFNRHIRSELKGAEDLASFPDPYPGSRLRKTLKTALRKHQIRIFYLPDGSAAPPGFFESIEQAMNLEGIPERVTPRYGVTVKLADQRVLPTHTGLFRSPGGRMFDQLQNSALDLGTPLILLHESRCGGWLYAISELCAGWMEASEIALCTPLEWESFLHPEAMVIACRSKVDVFLDPSGTVFYEYLRMGARLPMTGADPDMASVLLPIRRPSGRLQAQVGFVPSSAVHPGPHPFTARHVMQQAFEMLYEPYGWGGLDGEQDCSRFIQQIFATVGVHLPRNSADQARVGEPLEGFDASLPASEKEQSIAEGAVGGAALLYMRGHIMLYLGSVGGRAYAIHNVWAYREPDTPHDPSRIIGRVAVTDLRLGGGPGAGSWLDRLRVVRIVAPVAGGAIMK
ncbi:putative NlpC/P60 family protein [uncultured Desulfatiglans sp.]|uniref:Putative NlpC/P60 family protein n=1 Tax=Uncultured Desulfatiglans sp. TaxID=1748965 RepID=A0A653AD71_UNCDX|nr:putative NlpC/P60 family protein [uncultured Desulfatiglans sp.]